MKKKRRPDMVFLMAVFLLLMLGLLMIISTSPVVGKENFNDSYFFIKRHLLFLGMGLVAFLTGSMIPPAFLKKIFPMGFLGALIMVGMTLIPGIGVNIAGASRWLNIGITYIQPVEIMKFFIIVFMAIALSNKKSSLQYFSKGCLPIFIMIALPIVLLMRQPDLGNTGLILMVVFAIITLSNVPFKHVIFLIISGGSFLVYNIYKYPYQLERIKGFLSPWDDPFGRNYHTIQSFIAIGSGGPFGLGLGESKLKFFYLPLQYSDFIFSIIGEEGGFALCSLVVGLFLIIGIRGLRIGVQSRSEFTYFLSVGLTLMIVLQAIINMFVVTGLLPVTGIPLTFMSFGGTSLVTSLFYVGVITKISRERRTQ
jgi:cell division protein FtsW